MKDVTSIEAVHMALSDCANASVSCVSTDPTKGADEMQGLCYYR
jgi:hypothetical protein